MTNTPNQSQLIREAMQAIATRKPGRSKLVYDKTKRTIVAVTEGAQAVQALNITADDADMFGVVTLSSEWIRENWAKLQSDGQLAVSFSAWDNRDALTQAELCVHESASTVTGALRLSQAPQHDELAILLERIEKSSAGEAVFVAPDGATYRGAAQSNGVLDAANTEIVFADVEPQLALRRSGILETDILKEKTVLCIGLGTGGAHIAIELAKCGVGRFLLVDRDRLTVGNVVRHPGGISQVGRSKVHVMRDLIREKNPKARVEVLAADVGYENRDAVATLIAEADLVICGTDNRQSKLLINELCIGANVPALYGGAFRRAFGGQILRVRPKQSPCHQCFVAAMPEEASDIEVSSAGDADEIAYSDRPVAVEPGLSLDVLPIATQMAKLALLELIADKSSTLNALRRDFDAPWYLWLNRPEPGTQYADLPPLSESSDEMTINRWYGIYFDRDEACPVCGDFVAALAGSYGLNPSDLPALADKDG